jgi:ATPase subunit of ABC transporter with duplicated ATPase domains
MSHLIGAENISLDYPTKTLFENLTVGIAAGDRIGIVGRNGDGKSTLMTILAGKLKADSGQVTVRGNTRIGFMDQRDDIYLQSTVKDVVIGEMAEYEWASDPRIRDVIDGLISDIDFDSQMDRLSGGQRRRVNLAKLLIGDWDVLMLDEPTNHLDLDAVYWLSGHLKNRWSKSQGGLLVVTHDRWFLDEVCTQTWEVHPGGLDSFEGGYAAYILQRAERDRQAAATESRRQNLLRKELAWLRRGAPARTTKPKFRIDAANELIANEPPPRDPLELKKLATTRLGKDVVEIERLGFKDIFENVELILGAGDRIGLLGANGSGKTTLTRLITGDLSPDTGRVKLGKTVNLAVLSQNLEELDELADERIYSIISREKSTFAVGKKEFSPGQLLEQLGFSQQQLQAPVGDLSGGQKRRLQLMRLLFREPNVLILDEPTNDLDTDMLAAMEDLLDSWPGTLIVISHDRYLLERVTDNQYAILGDGKLRHLPGGVDQYLQLKTPNQAVQQKEEKKTVGLSGAEKRNLEKEQSKVSRQIEKTGEQIEQLKHSMAGLAVDDYIQLSEMGQQLNNLEKQLSSLEDEWLIVSEKLAE